MKTTHKKWPEWSKITILALTILVLLLAFDLSPLGGNIRFYTKWSECSERPLRTNAYPGGGVQWYEKAPVFQPAFRGGNHETYFCSPLDAERAGFSADSDVYRFPNLNKE